MPVLIVTPTIVGKTSIVEAVYSNTTFAFNEAEIIHIFTLSIATKSFTLTEV